MSLHRWGEPSFSPPYTAGGLSSLVSAPPWHYAGWLMNISFAYDAVGAVDVWWLSFVRFGGVLGTKRGAWHSDSM